MADHSNFFNGQASIQAAWRYVQAMDKGKFVSTVNEISGNIPKLPVPSAVVAPLDDFYGGISKEFTHQSKDLLTLVGMLLTAVVFAWFMGLLGPAIQLWTLTLALINSLRALESKNPAAIKSMLMYLLVMAAHIPVVSFASFSTLMDLSLSGHIGRSVCHHYITG